MTLQEFAVSSDPGSVPAGSVTFDVTNEGPDDPHEFVVIQTDLGPTELVRHADEGDAHVWLQAATTPLRMTLSESARGHARESPAG